jgi:hypothetical protein
MLENDAPPNIHSTEEAPVAINEPDTEKDGHATSSMVDAQVQPIIGFGVNENTYN